MRTGAWFVSSNIHVGGMGGWRLSRRLSSVMISMAFSIVSWTLDVAGTSYSLCESHQAKQ